jgi:hypothetical protein
VTYGTLQACGGRVLQPTTGKARAEMKKGIFLVPWLCFILLLSACAVPYHIKPPKFEVYPEAMQPFSSGTPIRIIVPQNAEKEFSVENLNAFGGRGRIYYVDLNELYKTADELMKEVLVQNKVPVSTNSTKYLKFSINKLQWENWGFVNGCYFYFTVETSDGYKQQYKVQDQSPSWIDRAFGGAVSRAVEKIFQDRMIIAFIESHTGTMQAAPATKQGDGEIETRLRGLKQLLDQGLINQEDYDRKKAELLDQL